MDTYKTDTLDLRRMDCMELMASMEDNSIDAIVTDPPYYKVKKEAWDRAWEAPSKFIDWIGELCSEWQRILKPNGSLYCFASPQMASRVECKIMEYFDTLNHITWEKHEKSRMAKHDPILRQFVPMSERIIFAEHYGSDNIAKGEAGYLAKCDELRGFVFEPLRAYFCDEFKRAGMLNQEGKIAANVACGFSPSAGGMASRHYFSQSQWQLPTEQHYSALRKLLNKSGGGEYLRREYEDLRREYEDLRREYEDLRREYEDLRRPFHCTQTQIHTDVWRFQSTNTSELHPCEKPQALLQHIINTSTRVGDLVFDAFGGSFSTALACHNTGRRFIGSELDRDYFDAAVARIERETAQLDFFTPKHNA